MQKNVIAGKIKALRIQKFGDSYGAQKEFADFLGVKYTTYRAYEQGKSKLGLDLLRALHDKLGQSVDLILFGETSAPTYSPEVQQYVDKLVAVLTGPDKLQAEKVKGYIDCLDVAPPLVERKKARASSSMTSKTGT